MSQHWVIILASIRAALSVLFCQMKEEQTWTLIMWRLVVDTNKADNKVLFSKHSCLLDNIFIT